MNNQRIEELIKLCRQDQHKAQKELYEHFYGLVMSKTKLYCSTIDEARELTNDVFYKVFTKLEQYTDGTNFTGWISTITKRAIIDKHRSEINKIKTVEDNEISEFIARSDLDILNVLEVEEKIALIQKLSPGYKIVFNLYVLEQNTHDEISKMLGITVGTSKSNLSKARDQLKQLIQKFHYTTNI